MKNGVAGIILAGGLSRRMGGGDKALRMLGGQTLLDRVASRLTPQVEILALNANGDPQRFGTTTLPIVPDTVPGYAGPLAGLLAGMEWATASTPCNWLLTVAADTPFFPDNLARRFLDAAGRRPGAIIVARCGELWHPTFALWPLALARPLRRALIDEGARRLTAFVEANDHIDVDFPPLPLVDGATADPFFNINTPRDLVEAERLTRSFA